MIRRLLQPLKAAISDSFQNRQVLGINQRNLWYVYPNNRRQDFPLADNKLKTKELMKRTGVPVPRTYRTYSHLYELGHVEADLASFGEMVIKPAGGRAGGGILVLYTRRRSVWTSIGGREYSAWGLHKHISDILFGVYSFDLQDQAIVEERIIQHPAINVLSPLGLADVRLILFRNQPVLAMIRLPTRTSGGRANLHQGAVGVGIDLNTGITISAALHSRPIVRHPDSNVALLNQAIPCWDEVLRIGRVAACALPLKYVGVDISLSVAGPVLLEVNVRPGLEIQNVSGIGLRELLEKVESDAQDEK